MKKFKFFMLRPVTLVLLLLCMSSFSYGATILQEISSASTIETIKKRGVLKVGMDIFQPWAMKDKNGKLIGFEIDVATRLAEDMGVKVEFIPQHGPVLFRPFSPANSMSLSAAWA